MAEAAKERPEDTLMANALSHLMSDAMEDKLLKLFNTAFYVASREKPFSDFSSLLDLQRKNGVCLGEQYKSDMQCKLFIGYIADQMKDNLLGAIAAAHFIMIDSSADITHREHCNFFVRFVDSSNVKERTEFLVTEKMSGGGAAHFLETTHHVLNDVVD